MKNITIYKCHFFAGIIETCKVEMNNLYSSKHGYPASSGVCAVPKHQLKFIQLLQFFLSLFAGLK